MISKKYGFDYFNQRAQILMEAPGRTVTHPLTVQIMQGETAELLTKIKSNVLQMISKGLDMSGNPLLDSSGNPAPGITASPDDRYNKWLLRSLILASDTEDTKRIDTSSENISHILYDQPLGKRVIESTGDEGKAWAKLKKYIEKTNEKANLAAQSRRIVLNMSLKDKVDYLKYGDSGAPVMKSAMAIIIKNDPNILKSEEFLNLLYDTTALADYMNSEEEGRVSTKDATAVTKASNKLSKLGIGVVSGGDTKEDKDRFGQEIGQNIYKLDALQNKARPLLTLIFKEAGYKQALESRKNKILQKFTTDKPINGPEDDYMIDNDYVANAILISGVLKWISHTSKITKKLVNGKKLKGFDDDDAYEDIGLDINRPKEFIEMFYNIKSGVPNSFIQFIGKMTTGISFKEFFEELEKLKNTYSDNEPLIMTLDLIKYYVKKSGIASKYIQKENSGQNFPGFDDKILEKHLNTPEKMEIFKQWYSTIYNPLKISEKKREIEVLTGQIANSKADENRAWSQFERQTVNKLGNVVDRSGSLDAANPEFRERETERLKSTPRDEWTEGDLLLAKQLGLFDKEKIGTDEQAMEFLRQDTRKKLADTHKSAFGKVKNESYIMSYMTEQIHKDKFKPKGEFKDRGFKKLNYLEWLDRNS